jgi:hypothetical protein
LSGIPNAFPSASLTVSTTLPCFSADCLLRDAVFTVALTIFPVQFGRELRSKAAENRGGEGKAGFPAGLDKSHFPVNSRKTAIWRRDK